MQEQDSVIQLHTSVKGAKHELLACAWLLDQGYEVFRNVSPVGRGDIVIWRRGETPVIVDVKRFAGRATNKQVKTLWYNRGEFMWATPKKISIKHKGDRCVAR